ncbi:hypothetical protein ACB094_11G058200 [Castanea mollissima]
MVSEAGKPHTLEVLGVLAKDSTGYSIMVSRIACMRFSIFMLHISIYTTTLITLSEAKSHAQMLKFHELVKTLKARSSLDVVPPLDSSDAELFGINSPFSIPPFETLAPAPLPEKTPPFCVNAPLTPKPPSSTTPSPIIYTPLPPPPPPSKPNFPIQSPPPSIPESISSPPAYSPVPNPPEYVPSPPSNNPSPPHYGPSPPKLVPSPPIYLPPLGFPPPTVPPPHPHKGSQLAQWCVAKPTVPDPIIQEAMDYACGSGADCKSIQSNGSCYQPDTLLAHASYAFNSYWQNSKITGGTCDFGGTAILVTVDPSFDECQFIYN